MINASSMKKYRMKKLAVLIAVLGAAGMGSGVSEAATTSGTFNVNITLTSTCTLGAIAPVAFAYTSLQVAAQPSTGGAFTISCTNTLPYSFGLQAGNGAPVGSGAASINVTDNSGINLNYTINAPAAGAGNGAAQNLTLGGTMAGGQSGTCGVGSCTNAASTNNINTLIVTY